jgi:hypothetical protein
LQVHATTPLSRVEVSCDADGLTSRAGTALLCGLADAVGLTDALTKALRFGSRRLAHEPGRIVRDLAVMLADGGDCLADLGALRDQEVLFGAVASDATAYAASNVWTGGGSRRSARPAPPPGPVPGSSAAPRAASSSTSTRRFSPPIRRRRARRAPTRAASASTRCSAAKRARVRLWPASCVPGTPAPTPQATTSPCWRWPCARLGAAPAAR